VSTPAQSGEVSPFAIVGRIRNAHGIKGELVVEPITDAPDAIFASGRRVFAGTASGDLAKDKRELHVIQATPFKAGFIVAFEEIRDRTEAELWRQRYLLVPQDELTPLNDGEIYVHELPGMRVLLASGDALGTVDEVYELPQGLAIDVRRADGRGTVLVLYDQSVTSVSREGRTITVELPEGMLD
jgi:16S rRNA processing protein RimM